MELRIAHLLYILCLFFMILNFDLTLQNQLQFVISCYSFFFFFFKRL